MNNRLKLVGCGILAVAILAGFIFWWINNREKPGEIDDTIQSEIQFIDYGLEEEPQSDITWGLAPSTTDEPDNWEPDDSTVLESDLESFIIPSGMDPEEGRVAGLTAAAYTNMSWDRSSLEDESQYSSISRALREYGTKNMMNLADELDGRTPSERTDLWQENSRRITAEVHLVSGLAHDGDTSTWQTCLSPRYAEYDLPVYVDLVCDVLDVTQTDGVFKVSRIDPDMHSSLTWAEEAR